ncbi:MAG: trypsin-like peptidase domain-containing protein [Cyanobacteriota bacterium]
MNKTIKKLLLVSAFLFILKPSIAKADSIESSVIKVFTTSNSPNYYTPWKMKNTTSSTGSGVVIEGNRILTCAHVITEQTFLQVQKNSDPKKYIAKVEWVSHDSDLAILKVDDETFFDNAKAIEIGELTNLQDNVMVYGFPRGGSKLSITKGVVSRLEITSYSHGRRNLLTVQIDAAINPGNSGGPVIKDKKIVGIAFQTYSNSQSLGYMVPIPIIKHFMDDIKDGKYDGFPKVGINSWSVTENPALRKYYKIDNVKGGILINKINYGSPAYGKIRKNDVLLKIDGQEIASDGTIEFNNDDRLWFTYLISAKQTNDKMEVELIRDGKKEIISLNLFSYDELVKDKVYDQMPSYFSYAGFVFTKLSKNLIEEWGEDWYSRAPFSFVRYNEDGNKSSLIDDIPVIVDYLPDELNVGYGNASYKVVKKVNGIEIKSLNHLVETIKGIKDEFLNLELEPDYNVIIPLKDIETINKRISDIYKVPFYSDDIKEMFFKDKK